MSLATLLQYDSDDDEASESRQSGGPPAATEQPTATPPPATAAPIALHPISHSAQPVAPIKQLEKRALSDDGQTNELDGGRKRKRADTGASSLRPYAMADFGTDVSSTLRSAGPVPYVPPPASFFAFAAPASSAAPAAPTDLLSMLPPPKNTRTRNTAQSLASPAVDHSSTKPSASSEAPSPPPRPPTPPPLAATASAALPALAGSTVSVEPALAAPPGVRRKVAAAAQEPDSAAFSSFSSLSTVPRLSYSTASPYAVKPSSFPSTASSAASALPSSFAGAEEPRMQRQWLEAAHIVDVRVDDYTQPPSAADIAASQELRAATSAADMNLRTTYWDARQGKEVSVVGVAGKQQRTHQINSLAIQAKKVELEIMRLKASGAQARRAQRARYGW